MEQHLEVLQEAERYLGNVEHAIRTMIEKLKRGDTEDCFHKLGMLSEGVDWLLAVFKMTEETQVEKIDTSELTDTIATLVEGMEGKDWKLLSDCLEYSLLDQIIEWRRVVCITLNEYHIPKLENKE